MSNSTKPGYETINGKQYKKCPVGYTRNPQTMRCRKADYETINGKKYKKCPVGSTRNPQTMRCKKSPGPKRKSPGPKAGYETINGKQYKKCPVGSTRDPQTMRCRKSPRAKRKSPGAREREQARERKRREEEQARERAERKRREEERAQERKRREEELNRERKRREEETKRKRREEELKRKSKAKMNSIELNYVLSSLNDLDYIRDASGNELINVFKRLLEHQLYKDYLTRDPRSGPSVDEISSKMINPLINRKARLRLMTKIHPDKHNIPMTNELGGIIARMRQ